ncbi:MAG: nucleoside hydrolase [Frankiales bacterium]|nr:nucleoside hydrolase [Frankiales bacterium]
MTTTRRKVILDTDPGVGIPGTDADDPIAIMLALADPRLELLGVTTIFGNCPPSLGARGAAAVLAAAGRSDVPIAVGMPHRLSGDLPALLVEAYAGARGHEGRIPLPDIAVSTADVHAVDFLIETVLAAPGEVTVIAIGPQTNIAMAMLREPRLAGALHSIVFMGGALGLDPTYGRGNVTTVAECNIWFDAQAADIVLSSGVDLTMVSLDVTNPTMSVVLTDKLIASIDPASSRIAPLLLDICSTYLESPMFDWAEHAGCVLYDPLAVAIAADASVARFESMAVAVETRGDLTHGMTVPLRDAEPTMRVCVDVDGSVVVPDIVRTILTL